MSRAERSRVPGAGRDWRLPLYDVLARLVLRRPGSGERGRRTTLRYAPLRRRARRSAMRKAAGELRAAPGETVLRSRGALLASGGVLALTVIHHVYGAVVYATPWRLHVAFVAMPALLVLILAHAVLSRRPRTVAGRVSWWSFVVVVLVVPVGAIGLFEGGYNHLLKNLLFFGGVPGALLERLYPGTRYELPGDIWFEATGVLQFFVGAMAGYYLVRLWRARRARGIAAP